ncbi:MAG TPA: hypothetical protein VLD55_07225 [Candidatus Sulfobium mesophilum]|nr:hypothetical protein [Candidatus Sulfobium mesophilum]
MILVLGLLPFFTLLISALILGNAGRNAREKITLFFYSPDDTDKDSSKLIAALRFCFWISLFVSVWMVYTVLKGGT